MKVVDINALFFVLSQIYLYPRILVVTEKLIVV